MFCFYKFPALYIKINTVFKNFKMFSLINRLIYRIFGKKTIITHIYIISYSYNYMLIYNV